MRLPPKGGETSKKQSGFLIFSPIFEGGSLKGWGILF
jgi:CHASE1-domain containing sensor protein